MTQDEKWATNKRQKLKAKGVPDDKIEQVIQQEEFDKLSVNDKLRILVDQAVQQMAQQVGKDIAVLLENQQMLAAQLDHSSVVLRLNFTAFARLLETLGVSPEKQRETLSAVLREFEAQQEEAKQKATEAQTVQEIQSAGGTQKGEGVGADPPEGATLF